MTMNFIRKISFDRAALSLVTIAAAGVLGEAATRSSLGDAQSARECRYPPLGSIVTEGKCDFYLPFWYCLDWPLTNEPLLFPSE